MKSHTSNHKPTHEQIAQRAYAIFELSGRVPGRDQENWLQAERELNASNGHKTEVPQRKGDQRATAPQAVASNRSQPRLERKYA